MKNILAFTSILIVSTIPMRGYSTTDIFHPVLTKTTTRFYKFHKLVSSHLNSTVTEPVSDASVQQDVINPLFKIIDAYLRRDSYVVAAKQIKVGQQCHVFSYCSVCDLKKDEQQKILDNIASSFTADPKTSKVFSAMNTLVSSTNQTIKLTGNPNYHPPKDFHSLAKNMLTADASRSPLQAKYDALYFELLLLTTVPILTSADKGAPSYEDIHDKVKPYTDTTDQNIMTEIRSCSTAQSTKKSQTTLSPSTLKTPVPKSKTSSKKKGLLDESFQIRHKDKGLEGLFRFSP